MSNQSSFVLKAVAVCLLFSACAKEPVFSEGIPSVESLGTIDLVVEADSKAYCSGLNIKFEVGDLISVNNVAYAVEDVDGALMLKDVARSQDNNYACIYPAAGNFLGYSDSNYKWPNVQYYKKDSFGRDAMPLICYASADPSSTTLSLSFSPAMGVLVLPISATGVQIRSIKVEDNNFNPGNGMTYMSGRMLPADKEGKRTDVLTPDSRYLEMSSATSTAECPNIVLLCNDAEGKGISLSGKRNFYIVVPAREYSNGFAVTITDNAHRSQTLRTTGSTTVEPGEKITMKTLTYNPSGDLFFSENFDTMVYGSDPIGMRSGVAGYRGYLPNRSGTSQGGLFADSKNTGFEANVYFGNVVTTTDSGSASIKESTPGSDIYANWHTNATSDKDDVFSCSDINTLTMSESYIRLRGMWDWCPSRIMEFQGYVLVGKSKSLDNAFTGLTSTGSPQGALKTPALSNITNLENIKLSFKIAKGYGDSTQKIRIACQGSGHFLRFSCGSLATELSEDGRYAFISNASQLSNSAWMQAEGLIAGASSTTHFQFFSPDGSKGAKTTTFFLDDITVTKADVKEEAKIKGTVTCNGQAVKDVVVTDGYSVTKTDSEGKYYIAPSLAAKFVYVSTPSGYEVSRPSGDILTKYFKSIDPTVENIVNFELKQVNQSDYLLFVLSDSHVLGGGSAYGAKNDKSQYRDIFIPSASSFIKNQVIPVYGIHLGDYSQCEYWGSYSLANYYADTKALDIPFYHTIGNHDHDFNSGSYGDSHTGFESVLGPRYHSFTIGTQHYVMLDDVTVVPGSTANDGFDRTFTSEQISWLRQDIAALPSGITQIVVCTHCPVLSASGSSYNIDATAGATLFNILKNYEVVCLTGHNHYDRTIKGVRNGHNVIDFVHPSLAGTAWFTTLADDGTPRSAGIYRINGSSITRSLYSFDNPEGKTYTIYNKAVDENTGTKQTSLDDKKGTKEAILVNFPLAYTCEFSESTGGQGTTDNGVIYDLNFRDFYVNFNVSGKKLGNWQAPTAPRHIWRYIPANPSAVITIKAKDAYGRSISTESGQFITTKIEH